MTIVPFSPDRAPAFSALNRAWIEQLFAIEPADLKVLEHPESAIITPGGAIFFALDAGVPVGTAAGIAVDSTTVELAKMAVDPVFRGQGVGLALGQSVIDWARETYRAEMVFLLTNSRLAGAIRLYERLGFVQRPLPAHTDYARADVYMELSLAHASH
jgi:putative acetyltransferase